MVCVVSEDAAMASPLFSFFGAGSCLNSSDRLDGELSADEEDAPSSA